MSERIHAVQPWTVLAAACAIAASGLSSSCATPKIMPQAERPIRTTNVTAPSFEYRPPPQAASPDAAPAPPPPASPSIIDASAPSEAGFVDAGAGGDDADAGGDAGGDGAKH